MKNIIIIFLIIVISLLIANTANYQEKSQKDNATIIQILKNNEKLQLEIIDYETRLEECYMSQDTSLIHYNGYYNRIHITKPEPGSAQWFPTHNEWNSMSVAEKKVWERKYNEYND
jgi:hypothetical protein